MKKYSTTLLLILFSFVLFTKSFAGDTIRVQTFTFGSPQDAVYYFPPDTFRIEKILMNYKLKCNPAQTPACGEWDYLTYSFLYKNTGIMDSTLLQAPSFIADGASPDSLQYNTSPAWNYSTSFQYFPVNTSTISFDSTIVGNGVVSMNVPFGAASPHSRTQFLWKASELSSAGLTAGNLTGIRFEVTTAGSMMRNLTIKIKNSTYDSLKVNYYETTALTTVYKLNTTLVNGWNALQFLTPFNWNGTSNLLVEISYESTSPGSDNIISGENTAWYSGVYSADSDKSLFCFGNDFVSVPSQAFASIDSFVTISFWQYGNTAFQPQDQISFEGLDSLNRRVLNVHLPWSNSNVYWDAGNSGSGSYDRINKLATTPQFAGQWNHWAFVKNAATGKMNIYLNGSLWHTGTGLTRLMNGIKKFKIGGAASAGYFYDGNIDEFAVFNKELDSTTIQQWMYKDINFSHPNYSNLQLYYKFNDNSLSQVTDGSINSNTGSLFGTPELTYVPGRTLFRNFAETSNRPNVIFEQGVYNSNLDSLLVIDSTQKAPIVVVKYFDFLNPTTPTDTLVVWTPYYSYTYNSSGIVTDSTFHGPDNTLYLTLTPYYSAPFEIVNRFELGRFITPYGNGLDLGTGFTWIFDVTDYEPVLHDSVRLAAGNWQELLDMSFDIIKGTPSRDVMKVENIWSGNYGLSSFNTAVATKNVSLGAGASQFRIKTRTTGHGFNNPSNCAEFCQKNHYLQVNGVNQFQWLLWDECSLNPVYPQGGTWIYDRAGWCPGADVLTYDWELTPYVTPGSTVALKYNIDSDPDGNYVLESNLVSYSAPNFTLDAAIEKIKSPSKMDIYKRLNPICSNPIITIKNNGTTTLTSLKINYGMAGAAIAEYNWTGDLQFLEETDVTLGSFWWTDSSSVFEVNISSPNGGTDQYADNNNMLSPFNIPPSIQPDLVFELFTGNYFWEDSYTVKNEYGDTLIFREGTAANTYFRDTISLPPGCYELRLTDTGDDGLSWWANTAQGGGSMRIKKAATTGTIKTFNSDFGREILYNFSVSYFLNTPETFTENIIEVFPNPTSGNVFVEVRFTAKQNPAMEVYTISGQRVFFRQYENTSSVSEDIDMSNYEAGIYFLKVVSEKENFVKKIVLVK